MIQYFTADLLYPSVLEELKLFNFGFCSTSTFPIILAPAPVPVPAPALQHYLYL